MTTYRIIQNVEMLGIVANMLPDERARCEHEDWNRLICDWERCSGTPTTTVWDGYQTLMVCDEDVYLYEAVPEL